VHLEDQLPYTLRETRFDDLGKRYEGKVRDVYRRGDLLLLITTDRLSAFDCVLTTIPFKGEVLNRLSHFWFQRLRHVAPNALLDMPDPNVMVVRACQPYPIEVVVRGYLTGSLWRDYQRGLRPYGLELPMGLRKDERFPAPLITPSTKAPQGQHDEPISEAELVARGLVNARDWGQIRERALALFQEGQAWAQERGLILVDTKYEFGESKGELYVIDEIHTPDSSRYWRAAEYGDRFRRGEEQAMLDKENIRQWLLNQGFSGNAEPPAIPDSVRIDLAQKYLTAYEAITGEPLPLSVGPVEPRIRAALATRR
jgi:phosphoribosylaminoimidazole-succinocarboxamide synthase